MKHEREKIIQTILNGSIFHGKKGTSGYYLNWAQGDAICSALEAAGYIAGQPMIKHEACGCTCDICNPEVAPTQEQYLSPENRRIVEKGIQEAKDGKFAPDPRSKPPIQEAPTTNEDRLQIYQRQDLAGKITRHCNSKIAEILKKNVGKMMDQIEEKPIIDFIYEINDLIKSELKGTEGE